ncbi:cytochrome P450 CYP12A2-like [Hyposmocoma kahamanoa]|uniref:cytochrome P450 CYP12A2-like n=1 Tax=Hyposmocoma kahamanoa TaxID=1477025 RepID=UPI000E6D8F64|nr:cytochrome P450 CYP12A2-like [Hyposmocoma kahamanoa]
MKTMKQMRLLNHTSLRWNFLRAISANNASTNVAEQPVPVKSWKEIPGPSTLPIIGQLLHFLPGQPLHDVIKIQKHLYEMYGPIARLDGVFGRPPFVVLYDPESCARILRGENWLPIRPGMDSLSYYRKTIKKDRFEFTGLVSDHGEVWKKFRSAINPVLLQPKTIKLYVAALEEIAADMIKRMKDIRDENNMLKGEFDQEMNLWALESIGVVALGRRLNCFDPNLAENSNEKKLIKCIHDIFTTSFKLDFQSSLWKYISTRTYRRAMKLYEEQDRLAKYFVDKAREELKEKKASESEKGVLEKLLEIDERIAVIMASDMLFAGVDTTANTVTSILYQLAKNTEKQDKLREELRTENPEEPRKYLKACIKEGMRIQPVVGGNLRQVTKDYDILGYRIPTGMYVMFSHQQMSIMESQFPKPLEYIPERWLEKNNPLYYKNTHPFSFSPWGYGVRMCAGRRVAELEIETFLAKVIQNFKVKWFGPSPRVEAANLNYVKGPFNFIFKDA